METTSTHLSDEKFPVDRISIVAENLRFVEQVTGRVGYGRAALNGLSSGAAAGALFGFVFGLFSLIDPLVSGLVLAFWGLIFGAIVGLIVGLLSHALSGGERDFSSVKDAGRPLRRRGRRGGSRGGLAVHRPPVG